jgi:hypothetical protein
MYAAPSVASALTSTRGEMLIPGSSASCYALRTRSRIRTAAQSGSLALFRTSPEFAMSLSALRTALSSATMGAALSILAV